ncbi:hypothetical protein CXF72_02025 [Psychromonas sp. MB-3u-54]|uniref:hypothetical protein n=1 Tax=Psychromonas sp. MB-3u-54 TaxID=2058319 RepID=UPI000C3427FB|nr:hypothetical protein [Psychromonas sp. MB-3u-54]PKH04268.1 hypothetical protein CXF72_02025 [Psychromonas sp. MB-3u-54]
MPICLNAHRNDPKFNLLPIDQGGHGRHRCCGCAYDAGFKAGIVRSENLILDLDSLPESQAGVVRHKSPHAAFAQGYYDGVASYYD